LTAKAIEEFELHDFLNLTMDGIVMSVPTPLPPPTPIKIGGWVVPKSVLEVWHETLKFFSEIIEIWSRIEEFNM
jgi:hypothetical protein